VVHPVENFTQTFGGGISGELFGDRYFAGNADYLASVGTRIDDTVLEEMNKLSANGKTTVLLAKAGHSKDGHPIGMIALADTIKNTTAEAVRHLKHLGMDIVMLTGDSEKTAHAIAREAGIERVLSGVKPDEKASYIEKIMTGEYYGDNKRRFVVMVGDGINDAPALVMADCGIAVAHGTDIAIESASVVLVRSNPSDVAGAISLSRAIMRNITQNLCWAFGYNVLCIPIAAGVLFPAFGIALTPMIASAAMSFSSICVVGNALRLRRFRSA
jgi:Cu+-exporting ATPase